jgi:transposase
MSKVRFVGMDVHAERIAVAVAEPGGEVRSLGTIANRPESIRKMIGKLGPVGKLKCCYEAGPTGYVLYWQLTQMGVACEVIAPSLIPVKAGDRVKTDRRDAEKLARCYQKGDLTAVWVPDASHEALRDLVRAREAAKKGSTSSSAPAGQVSATARQTAGGSGTSLGQEVHGLDSGACAFRGARAGNNGEALSA